MKILIFDTEHSNGIYRPWEPGFYLSCFAYQFIENGVAKPPEVLWYSHKDVLPMPEPQLVATIQKLFDSADMVVAHNLKHDMNILRWFGVDFEVVKLWCTMLVDYMLEGQSGELSYGLDEVAERRGFGRKDLTVKLLWDRGVDTYDIPLDTLETYAKRDVELTGLIYLAQEREVREKGMTALVDLQNEFTLSLSDMEMNGFKLDVQKAEEMYAEYDARVKAIHDELREIFEEPLLNFSSGPQLSAALFGGDCEVKYKEWVTKTLKTKPETRYYEKEFKKTVCFPGNFPKPYGSETKKEGVFSTDKDTIDALPARTPIQRRIKELLLDLSATEKVRETLRGKKADTGLISKCVGGFVHARFNQCITTTGRLSSSDPNAQNMPRGNTSPIKTLIGPRYDCILQCDLSQIEWRAAAWLSQDPVMMHEINSGVDQHTAACVDIMKLPFIDKHDPESKQNRTYAKIFNFRMIYGGTPHGFFADNKMPNFSKKSWQRIVDEFYKKYSGLKDWQDTSIAKSFIDGVIVLPTGRRFHLRKVSTSDGVPAFNERHIKNYPVQGISGGDILPLVCVLIRRGLRANGLLSKLILTVHDSIVFDCPMAELKRVARLCYLVVQNLDQTLRDYFGINWNVKLDGECEYGTNYGNLKEITYEETLATDEQVPLYEVPDGVGSTVG